MAATSTSEDAGFAWRAGFVENKLATRGFVGDSFADRLWDPTTIQGFLSNSPNLAV
jgi:hypothetical protein